MSYRPIQHYRGNEADLPQLMAGEIGVATDTKRLFFGAGGNQEVARVGYVPTMTTADIYYHVNSEGSDETGDGSEDKPFKTVQHALDLIPDFIRHTVTIHLASGATFNEDIITCRNHLGGDIAIESDEGRATINCKYLAFSNISSHLELHYLDLISAGVTELDRVLSISNCRYTMIRNTKIDGKSNGVRGFYILNSNVEIYEQSSASNTLAAIFLTGKATAKVYDLLPGSGNEIGMGVDSSIIFKAGTAMPAGETAEVEYNGGIIQ
ncbi:hypothetical protein NIE88_04955 [Sporolactobacillus shoreicorticis]|uniref:Major tropism determinant N-terminal domain-containing protein n=1 Tax=Sporolactobacillus shoreicorticis TaxID=1923877 RepID=A0ABW5S004_9BACL|nr:hypothetical protein [Sporolactobacillus shoreicorticis]MCO7125123.1 hypothetical protein [Sporolactobacillus shoreicorticis]